MHKNFIGFRDRVLLHLLRFEKEVYENIHGNDVDGQDFNFLKYLTQEGIAEGIGTKQSSIFKELHALCLPAVDGEMPLIKSMEKVRVPGRDRVCSIYFLTQYGLELTKQKLIYLEEKNVELHGLTENEQMITVKDLTEKLIDSNIEQNFICGLLRIASVASAEGVLNWNDLISFDHTSCEPVKISKPTLVKKPATEEIKNPYFNRIAIKDRIYFYGRENEVRYITSLLQNTQSCSIIGPRRIGKSSLINNISNPEVLRKNGLDPDNYIFVFIDLEGLGDLTQTEFFYLIVEELRNRVVDKDIRGLLEGTLDKEQIRFIDLKKIFRYITKVGKKVIFLFDEFELITNNKNLDFNFYSGLRNLANSYKVGYITASHVPLLQLTFSKQTLGSPFFNFFAQIEIGLMSDQDINELIVTPASKHDVTIPQDIIDYIKKSAGPHPFFVQMLCFHIFDWIKKNETITIDDLPKIQELFMNEAVPHFQYFWNHLSTDEQQLLKDISNNHAIEDNSKNKSIIQSLRKRALLVEGENKFTIFSDIFSEYILNADTIDIDGIKQPMAEKIETTRTEPQSSDAAPSKEYEIRPDIDQRGSTILEFGNNYFVNESTPKKTISIYNELIGQNLTGLIITRTPTKKVEQNWGVENSTVYWLCSQPGPGNLPPIVGKISHIIIEFIKQNQPSIIFLDGLEFIINNNDFSKTLHLMDNLKEMVAIHDSIFVIPMSSAMFSEQEMALLSKNFIEIPKESTLDLSKFSSD